jgi:hypothetical protein
MDAADLDVLASNVNGLRRAQECTGGSEYAKEPARIGLLLGGHPRRCEMNPLSRYGSTIRSQTIQKDSFC